MAPVTQILRQHDFSFSAEIIPPRNGTGLSEVFDHITLLRESGFRFISVTHGAGGSLRGGTLPISHYAQNQHKLTAIAHLTVRGATREDLENLLIDHHYFGIRNILALRGDPPDGIGATFAPAPGGHEFAWQFVEQIRSLNEGHYLVRHGFDKTDAATRDGAPTEFCIGVAAYPEDENAIPYLRVKREAGAHFSISQMLFDAQVLTGFYEDYLDAFGLNFPFLPGIRIPSRRSQLLRLRDKFGIEVPDTLLSAFRSEADPEAGMAWSVDFAGTAYKLGIKGLHVFIMGDPAPAIELRHRFVEKYAPEE